jgi:hypothetical protein
VQRFEDDRTIDKGLSSAAWMDQVQAELANWSEDAIISGPYSFDRIKELGEPSERDPVQRQHIPPR